MPKALDRDLRIRIVTAYNDGEGSYREIAARFGVGEATVKRLVWRFDATGDVGTLLHLNGGKPELGTPENIEILRKIVEAEPDLTYPELAAAWSSAIGKTASRSLVVKLIGRMGYTLKKKRSARRSATSLASKRSATASRPGSSKPT